MEYSFRLFAIRHKYTGYSLFECEVPESVEPDMIQEYLVHRALEVGTDLTYAELNQ